jgi:homoserine dehydrogenase
MEVKMGPHNLCFLGLGNVGRELARLLEKKSAELSSRYGITWRVTGVASRRLGWRADPEGLDLRPFLAGDPSAARSLSGITEWLEAARADVLFEMTSLNAQTGQPAIDHLRAALEHGSHAITANKGPLVHAYAELSELARRKARRFLFESAVMDGAPIFSLWRECLPAAHLQSFRGILNSTTNLILTLMAEGKPFEEAVAHAQSIGIAETDPSADVQGWDAAVKVAALVTVLMEAPLKPSEVERQGIAGLTPKDVALAREQGRRWKLVCCAERSGEGVRAWVAPELLGRDDPLYSVEGTSSAVVFRCDVLPSLTIVEGDPGPETTAYGLLADFIAAVRKAP